MLFKNLAEGRKYFNEAGDDGSKDGGNKGGFNLQEALNNPEIQKAIQSRLDQEVSGLKSKNEELLGKLKKLKVEPEEIDRLLELKKKVDANEEMKLLSEGKLEEVLGRRTEAMKRDAEANISARDNKIKELDEAIKSKNEKLASLIIDGQVREAYIGLDFEPAAMDDILRLGRDIFQMDETGKAVPRDGNGNLIFGKDGKTPITASEWLEGLADKKPYLRRQSKGGGAQNNRGSGNLDVSKMNSVQKIAHGLKELGMK